MSRRRACEFEPVVRQGVHGWLSHKAAQRYANPVADWLASMPLIAVLAVTIGAGMLLAPVGLALIPTVLMLRHHGRLSGEFAEAFGQDSPEHRELRARPGDLGRALELDRDRDFVTDPRPGGFIASDETGEAPRFKAGFGRRRP